MIAQKAKINISQRNKLCNTSSICIINCFGKSKVKQGKGYSKATFFAVFYFAKNLFIQWFPLLEKISFLYQLRIFFLKGFYFRNRNMINIHTVRILFDVILVVIFCSPEFCKRHNIHSNWCFVFSGSVQLFYIIVYLLFFFIVSIKSNRAVLASKIRSLPVCSSR